MLVLLAIFGLICLYRIKFSSFHPDYMGTGQTGSIKGIFAMVILFSHLRGYLTVTAPADLLYCALLDLIGQLMVTLFFFYSGYGILESFKHKENYTGTFFRNRILKTLVHFDMAVLLFLILSLLLGQTYPPKTYLLCWVGWTSLGNSNWFVFDMLVLYLVTWFALLLAGRTGRKPLWACLLTTAFSLVLWMVLRELRPGFWEIIWYNTILCYPLGMWYSLVRERLDRLWQRRKALSWLSLFLVGLCFVGCGLLYRRTGRVTVYSLYACVFSLLVVLVTTKVKVDNPILRWLGENSFAIYILQRLPMILMEHFGLARYNLLFAVLSIALTLPLAWGFNKLYALVDQKLFPARQLQKA